ncbi:hypothetical protein LCGC14_1500720 [marine sediment metagenome]|uniref:Uncharacterized protein n=1 Tax=marine sediment metagenome TaxID=412755 RepID=A0A0F9J4P6_9ZZZZ|nr:hypothetical protein [Methylophaga sp.]HEC59787.1 hypothetical protein [Methylophaga sp.]
MNKTLKNLSELIAQANDIFDARYKNIGTVLGILDQALRKQGIKADAVTINCIALNKKIVFLIYDDKPELVDIALGNKEGDIHSSSAHPLKTISATMIVEIMETNFLQ